MARVSLSPHQAGLVFITEIQLDNIPAVKAMLAKTGKPIPPPLKIRALVDTGASQCATTKANIQKLKLHSPSTKVTKVNTAGGVIDSLAYHGAIFLAEEPSIKADLVTIHETFVDANTPFEFVIGMTALNRWNFWYSRSDQKLTIEG